MQHRARPAGLGRPLLVESGLDQPLAVVTVGPSAGVRSAVLGVLLDTTGAALRVPRGSFLVVGYGDRIDGLAYVPGYREPVDHRPDPVGAGPALARPPRRVELTRPEPLLRHFALVDTPDLATLGAAGQRLVLDAVDRGGALLVAGTAGRPLDAAAVDLLTEVSRGDAAVFFVLTPATDGGWDGAPDPAAALDRHRAELRVAVPALAGADWFAVDPATPDPAVLRRALLDWAGPESLRRASVRPPVPPDGSRRVPLVPGRRVPDWPEQLDRQARTAGHRLRQHLALELANIHLRCVQAVVFGAGCAGLPEALDRELHALSSVAVTECDEAVDRLLDDTLALVLDPVAEPEVRRRVVAAVRWTVGGHRPSRDLERVLLVTNAGEVTVVAGRDAVAALAGYPTGRSDAILPPLGLAVAGGAYQFWRTPANADPARARSWLRRALREVELELSRETNRRIEAVRVALTAVLTDSAEHGVLLA
ncbi:hypothetical protein O7627_07665 [Solwaraspora sp. WMMD1047]|uniref:hypothetical protein n=1 Tax=Solwaraspora sp. WMMD1047 TaxID=3016102 RepID=UPI0024160DB6|nr:hypothetical protein [Solwaraspora sp. WMMD1047]MDG4829183.1 hypothetical protein [Solwaraspora sp. WMMD1047]